MELLAALFALTILVVSAWITYHLGIKPDREQRRRRVAEFNARMRRQGGVKPARYHKQQDVAMRNASTAALRR